ncbi:MAG TPA: hypothetical protein DER67_00110 [Novosphingobium sp.]|nr:hypothetical protein [Novosphingobium sp.]
MMNRVPPQKMLGLRTVGVRSLCAMIWIPLAACTTTGEAVQTTISGAAHTTASVSPQLSYPSFRDFPAITEPAPDDAVIFGEVSALTSDRNALAADVAAIEWQAVDAGTLQQEIEAHVRAVGTAPEAVSSQAAISEFLTRARERGHAPPPVDRR